MSKPVRKTILRKPAREATDPDDNDTSWIDDLPVLPPLGQGYTMAVVLQRQPIRTAHASKRKRQDREGTQNGSPSRTRKPRKK